MPSLIVAELAVLLERATSLLPIRISGLVLCPPLLHVIHCCPFLPVACCTSVRTECSGRREVGVYRKGTGLPVWRWMVYGTLYCINCDVNSLCFQVGNKPRSWFVLVPYSKEYDLFIPLLRTFTKIICIIKSNIGQYKNRERTKKDYNSLAKYCTIGILIFIIPNFCGVHKLIDQNTKIHIKIWL